MKFYRFRSIGIVIIVTILLGHHSFAANALAESNHHVHSEVCESSECQHRADIDICEKIKSEQIKASSENFVFSCSGTTFYFSSGARSDIPDETYHFYREKVDLSHKELARSHLVLKFK